MVGAQPAQRCLGHFPDVFGPAVRPHHAPALDSPAEFRRQDHAVASALEGASEQFLVRKWPVGLGGVEERDAQLEGPVKRGDRFPVVRDTIRLTHGPAA